MSPPGPTPPRAPDGQDAGDAAENDTGLPVLVVGGGPVGLATANLLAARGVPVVLLERHGATSDEAKAISLDDESLRALAAADLAEDVLEIVVPGTGTRYHDRHGRVLFHARGPANRSTNYPFKNQFAQPELERVLLDALKSRANVEVRFAHELVGLTEHADRIRATVRPSGAQTTLDLDAGWVLGCDGGRSLVRELCAVAMSGTSHDELWLVVDTLDDPHDERFGLHYGMPTRPTVVIPGRDGRCRYEFLLRSGEADKTSAPDFALIQRLVGSYRALDPTQVERATVYTFNAVVAERWRVGRCLLLGDAAHMMPPFAGQGLNSGLRDAANLAWKLEHVWRGRAGETLLDTYEQERRPHASAMVRFSARLGDVVMTTSPRRALTRDLAVRALLRTRGGRRYLTEMRFRPPPRHRAGVVAGHHPLTGVPLPDLPVLCAPRLHRASLDGLVEHGWALLGVDAADTEWRRVLAPVAGLVPGALCAIEVVLGDRLPRAAGERLAVADADGRLEATLGSCRGQFVLVRPDHYVAAVFASADTPAITASLNPLLAAPTPE